MYRQSAWRLGFTLIEMLVVVAIISVLMGLLLPAVQKVREAASRMSCGSRQKNIGVALHNFASAHKRFPPGGVVGPFSPVGVNTLTEHGWVVFILPYIEQDALFKQYDRNRDWYDSANQPAILNHLKVLQCPSVRADRVDDVSFPDVQAACTDFAAIRGVNPKRAVEGLIDEARNYDGAMTENSMCRFSDILDGTSRTIVLSEDAGRPDHYEWRRRAAGFAKGGAWADYNNFFRINGYFPGPGAEKKNCAMNCTNNNEVYSFHASGANCLFADASVQFIRSSVDLRVFAKLVTRAGGENLAGADY